MRRAVGQESARAGHAIQLQRQIHLGGPFAGMGGDIGQQAVKIDALQLQPQRAGFHQRQVENVVDQLLQRAGAGDNGADIFVLARLSVPGTPLARCSEKPRMVLSGVRNS